MRRILWMIFLFGAYIWAMTSGHDRMLVEQGKNLVQSLIAWFDDAEVDFQASKNGQSAKKNKKRSRRWD